MQLLKYNISPQIIAQSTNLPTEQWFANFGRSHLWQSVLMHDACDVMPVEMDWEMCYFKSNSSSCQFNERDIKHFNETT